MKEEYGWSTVPRVVVHDKATYFVNNLQKRWNTTFACFLRRANSRSWLGDERACTKWLPAKLGDVYLHETIIAHVRRLLSTEYACRNVYETLAQL